MMGRQARVLVTDGDYKHTLGVVRSLSRAGYAVDVIGRWNCLCAWSRSLSKVAYPEERFCEEHIADFLDFLRDSQYDVLLPIGARSVQLASHYRDDIQKCCAVPIPSAKAIDLCFDKDETGRFALGLDIAVPRTWAFSGWSELEERLSELVFPVVIKDRHEVGKGSPLYAKTAGQLLQGVAVWGRGNSFRDRPFPVIQQYIAGTGVGFFALYQKGVCKRVFMHRRLRETPPSGGASCCAIGIYEPDLLEAGKKLLDALNWHGVAMVEFKRQKETGHLYLMEINPKFWGSLDIALASGVDFPGLDVRVALGEEVPYSEDYRRDLKFHWPLDGEISHFQKNPKALFPIIRDCLDPRVKSNLSLRDPLPAIHSMCRELRHVMGWGLAKTGIGGLVKRIRRQGMATALVRAWTEATGIPMVRYSQITPQIFVGAQQGSLGKRKLQRLGVNAVVNMRFEFDDRTCGLAFDEYCHLPTPEFAAPNLDQLNTGVCFIQRAVDEGKKIYIHCSEGISRAPIMAAAFFIRQGMTLPAAVALLKKARPFINILPVQMDRLGEFEKACHV